MQEHDTDLLEILNTYMDLAEKQEENLAKEALSQYEEMKQGDF